MRPCAHPIAELLAHREPMVLLDELVSYDARAAVAIVRIRESTLFVENGGVPVHIGLEYMAQTCGAHAGALALDKGEAVKIGFVLGTRQYRAHVPQFRVGATLTISISVVYLDTEMGAFDCRIEMDGVLAAEAQLKVYQPDPAQLVAMEGVLGS